MRFPKEGSYVVVEWEDAHGQDMGWTPLDEISHRAESVISVGILARRGVEGITLVLSSSVPKSADEVPVVGAYIFIPVPFIQSIRALT